MATLTVLKSNILVCQSLVLRLFAFNVLVQLSQPSRSLIFMFHGNITFCLATFFDVALQLICLGIVYLGFDFLRGLIMCTGVGGIAASSRPARSRPAP